MLSRLTGALKLVKIDEVASKAGYPPILKIDDYFDGCYIGSVHLMHTENGSNYDTPHAIAGKNSDDMRLRVVRCTMQLNSYRIHNVLEQLASCNNTSPILTCIGFYATYKYICNN